MYKFNNHEGTEVIKNGISFISEGGQGWEEYQQWVTDGGITAPYKNGEELEQEALEELWAYHNNIITSHGESIPANQTRKATKLNKALRKEAKGNANNNDIKLLDDNDTLDDWYDEMERAAEDDGESWIEDPVRTDQELIDFDPAVQVDWPVYPF